MQLFSWQEEFTLCWRGLNQKTTPPMLQADSMAPKKQQVIAAAATKSDRKRERKKLGMLRSQVIAPKTEERYKNCFESFLKFHRLQKSFALPPFEVFDDMAAEFIEALWEQGEPKSQANYTLASLQHFRPQAKHRLPWSWRLVKVWNTLELPQRATPLSPELLMALSGQAFRWHQPEFTWLLFSSELANCSTSKQKMPC